MARLLIGIEPAKLIHKGTIDGGLPQTSEGIFADPAVEAGKATFDTLIHGGWFKFNKKSLTIEGFSGGTPTIVDDSGASARTLPTAVPFNLYPGEGLKFATGSEVMIIVRENVTRIA